MFIDDPHSEVLNIAAVGRIEGVFTNIIHFITFLAMLSKDGRFGGIYKESMNKTNNKIVHKQKPRNRWARTTAYGRLFLNSCFFLMGEK